MADERKIPDSAIDAGGKTDNVSADAINRDGINATETNDAPTESREEQAKRLKEKKQASFEYADNYRQKLKKEAEERRMTPAQMRKKAEKEAMIAREKAEKEAAIRQAIEREKEEARERAERAASLRDQVEKSLAEKKAQEEAEREAFEHAQEQAAENAPVKEPIAEDVAEEPVEETSTEDVEDEHVDEYDSDDKEEEELDGDYDDDDELSGFTFDFDEDDDDMTFTFGYDDEEEDDDEEEPENDMILTFDADDIVYNYEKQPKKKVAKKPEEPTNSEETAPEVTVEDEPAPVADKPEAVKPTQTPKKKKKASPAPAPKKAVVMPKPAAKKPVSRSAQATPKTVPQPLVAPVAEPVSNGMDERIAELLEENKQLLKENIDELRRKQAELEQRQAALESATPAQSETDDTAAPAEVSMPESSEETVTEPVTEDEKPASYVPEEVIRPSAVIKESAPTKSAVRSEIKKIEEIPESELILNYVGEEASENLNSAAVVYGLTSLPPVSLRKKIRDNDRLSRKLERKLTKEKRDYRRAKTKEEKLEHIADCAEYQRAILDFDAESLAAAALLGNDYTTRKKHLRRDVGEYNAFAQKLEDMSTTQIPQAPATMPDDVVLGNPYKRLPAVTTANLADNDANDPGAARNKDANPMSYVSQLDNDDDSITGISGRPAGSKGAKKKHALVKGEVKKGASELKQKMRSNGKLLKENRKDLRNELEAANKSGFAEKTEHMVSGLNYQREIIAVLGDSYEAAVRTHDKAEAKRISRQIDKEVSAYNKLGRAVEKRTGEPIPSAFNTFAKDLADNREMKLPPVVKYGQATTEGSFTDSEDVLVIKRVDFAEQEGSAKIVQVGSKRQKSGEELSTITVIDEPVSAISVASPAEAVTVTHPTEAATLTPITPTVQTLKRSSDKKSYELKDAAVTPVAPSTQTAVYIEPIIIGHPIETPQVDTPLRPMSERIVEDSTTAKKIGTRSGRSDGSLPTVTLYDEDEAPASRISEKKSAKSVKAERPSKTEKTKKEEKVVYTLVEDTDHVKVFKADPTLKVVPRYDKVPLEEREVQVIKLKRVAEEPDSAKVIKANVPGVVPEDETFDFIPLVAGAESAKEEITEEAEVEAKEVMAERDFEPAVFRSSGESEADEIGKKELRKETSEREEKQENEVKDTSDETTAELTTEETVEEPELEEPVTEEVAEELVLEEPVTEEVAEAPVLEEPVTEEVAEQLVAEETTTDEAAEELVVEEPVTEEAVEEPAVEEPASEETVEELEDETEHDLPALVNYNKEENLSENKEEQPVDKESEVKRTVGEQPESAKIIKDAGSATKEQKTVREETDSAKILESIGLDADGQRVVSEEENSAKVFDAITVEAPEEENRVVVEETDSAKVLEGEEPKEHKIVVDEDSTKVFEGIASDAEEHKVVVIDDDSTKTLEATKQKFEQKRTVAELSDSAKVLEGKESEEPRVVLEAIDSAKVLEGKESEEPKVVLEEADSAKVFEKAEFEPEEYKVVVDDDSVKVFEAVEFEPEEPKVISEQADSVKVLDAITVESHEEGDRVVAENAPESISEEPKEALESIPEENDEIVHSGEETVTVLEEEAPKASEKTEEKEPKTATKGYILTENSNETKIIQGKRRVYTLTEEPDSAKRFEASAPTEIIKSGYSITEDHESAKVFSATVGIKREVVEDASGAKIIPAAESEPVVVRIVTESEGSEKEFDAKDSEPIAERTVATEEDSAKIIEAAQTEGPENRVVLERIDSAKVLDGAEQTLTVEREIAEVEDSAKVLGADGSKSKVSRGYVVTVDPKSAKIVEGRPELKYTVSVDESGRRTVTAELARAESEGKYVVTESEQATNAIEEASVSEVPATEECIEAAPEYSSLTAISSQNIDEPLSAADENVAEAVVNAEEMEASAELEVEPQLMAVEFDGSIPEIIEERIPASDELTAESGESIEAADTTNIPEIAEHLTEEKSELSDTQPEHTVTVIDADEAQTTEGSEEKPAVASTVKGVSEIPDSAKVLLGKVKRTVDEDHDAIKVIAGAPLRVVTVDTDAAKVIPASANSKSRAGAYVIKQQNRTPDGKLIAEVENDVLSVQGESVEVGEEASSYEYKLDDIDVEVPEGAEVSETDEAPRSESDAGTVTKIVDETEQSNALDANVELTDDGRITIAEKPTYRLIESTHEQAEADAKANIPLESLVTSRYTIEEHLPEQKPTESEVVDKTTETVAVAEVAEEKPEGSYTIKQYAPLVRADEQSDAERAENNTDARRPEQIIIYGKSKDGVRVAETEELENRELSTPKAKGAYTLLEGTRVKKTAEDTEDNIVHVGEETVEVIEDAISEEYVTLTSDTTADETKPDRVRAEISDTIVVSEGADAALKTIRESDSAKAIPAADVKEKSTDGYIITENSAETKRIEATAKGYTLTEEPDSAKRFEASEPVEIENGKYVITVSPEAARTIEGRPELKYTVAVDEDGKKTVKANIADEAKSGEYRIVEDKDGIRVLSGATVEDRHVTESARASGTEPDVAALVKPEPAPTYDAEHTAEVMEDVVSENYVTLTSDTEAPEGKPHAQKAVENTIVVNEKPRSDKGYTIEIDEDARLTISAREDAKTEGATHYGVVEQDGSARVVPSFTIINAPKSRDAYVITEDRSTLKTIGAVEAETQTKREIHESDGKVIGAVEAETQTKREIHESDGKVIGAVEAETQAKREIRESDGKVIGATERIDARKVVESPDDARVISSANDTGYEITIHPEDAHTIVAEQSGRVVSEIDNPKELLKTNKVLNTKKSQNNYAILESRDTKVIAAPESDAAEEAKPIGAVYTLGVEDGRTIPAVEEAVESPKQAYRISTDEEHRKILEAIETLKRANYDVSEIERAENMIHAAKVLNTNSDDNTYAIVESRDVKVISSAESTSHDGEYGVTERAGTERIIEATVQTEESQGYEIHETAQEPKAIEAKVINASKSRDSYVIMENRGSEKVIPEASAEEVAIEEAQKYEVYEKLGTAKTILGTDITPEVKHTVSEIASTGIIIPEGTKILNAEKGGDRYIIAEHRASEGVAENLVHGLVPAAEVHAQPTGYSINESADPYVVTQRKINRHGKPMVYEVGRAHVVSERKKLHEVKDPLVFEQVGTEKVISQKDFKLPAKPLIYEEIGTQKIVKSESSMRSTLKDSIVEYKGTEMVVKGKIPVVDILIDPYKNTNMGVLAIGDLKKYLSENDKEIAKLKYHFRYAKKTKAESERSADKIMAHIAMINNQCLICERYVERISVCNNAESKYYAEKGAAMLKDELKRYNDLITEYNLTTSSKIPLADKTLPKRVLAGEAYEHLTRISYNLINEQAPMKTSKKFSKKKKGTDKPAAKIIEQKRYLADIKLIDRCDNESANDVLMIQNRYDFESALLKGERDMMNFKFAKSSKKNASRKLYINRKLKSLKKAKAKAVRYEALDNERYYRVLACDTSLESYKNNNAKKKKVTKIVTEVGKLLKERDDINTKLNTMYAGTLADISGAGDGEKWRSVKAASAKKHSRKLRGKANSLKHSVPGFGEKRAERIHMFNSLLDAKVEAQSTIDLCKYRLRREKNKFADKMSIRKDIREARKRIRLIDREIKERRKLILEEHYGPDASFELTALVGMCVLGVIGVAWLAKSAGIDVVGIVKPYIQQWMDSIGAASPAFKSVIDMIKGYLM